MSNNQIEQFQHLRALTVRFNVLHEAQVLQIKNYPLIVPGVKSATIKVDVENRTVYYECEGRISKNNKKYWDKICQYLREFLIWPDTILNVKYKGKVKYDSREG